MNKMTSAVVLAAITALPVQAALKVSAPAQVCGFLTEAGLKTGAWKKQAADTFGCTSPYKELGTGIVPNTLAYYVDGKETVATRAWLVLTVSNRDTVGPGIAELLKASETLSKKIADTLPPTLRTAIDQGKSVTAKIGATTVEVKREDWPTGRGYEIRVRFQ